MIAVTKVEGFTVSISQQGDEAPAVRVVDDSMGVYVFSERFHQGIGPALRAYHEQVERALGITCQIGKMQEIGLWCSLHDRPVTSDAGCSLRADSTLPN